MQDLCVTRGTATACRGRFGGVSFQRPYLGGGSGPFWKISLLGVSPPLTHTRTLLYPLPVILRGGGPGHPPDLRPQSTGQRAGSSPPAAHRAKSPRGAPTLSCPAQSHKGSPLNARRGLAPLCDCLGPVCAAVSLAALIRHVERFLLRGSLCGCVAKAAPAVTARLLGRSRLPWAPPQDSQQHARQGRWGGQGSCQLQLRLNFSPVQATLASTSLSRFIAIRMHLSPWKAMGQTHPRPPKVFACHLKFKWHWSPSQIVFGPRRMGLARGTKCHCRAEAPSA